MTTTGTFSAAELCPASCIIVRSNKQMHHRPLNVYAQYRHLYESDGHFTEHHIQDWQHSAMYLAFMLAGIIDMMAHYTQLPSGIDQVCSPSNLLLLCMKVLLRHISCMHSTQHLAS